MAAVAGYGGYKAYGGYAGNERGMNPLLTENVEALSDAESSDPISLEYCWEKKGNIGNYVYICDSRTDMNSSIVNPPVTDIYECGSSTYQAKFSSKRGYCYKKNNNLSLTKK